MEKPKPGYLKEDIIRIDKPKPGYLKKDIFSMDKPKPVISKGGYI